MVNLMQPRLVDPPPRERTERARDATYPIFIDIPGASGSSYRFRLWPVGGYHPPMAGNYVVVVPGDGSRKITTVGVTSDLSTIWRVAYGSKSEALLYTRLNVARSTREAEHHDICAAHPKVRTQSAD
jgi:hypothetical protein